MVLLAEYPQTKTPNCALLNFMILPLFFTCFFHHLFPVFNHFVIVLILLIFIIVIFHHVSPRFSSPCHMFFCLITFHHVSRQLSWLCSFFMFSSFCLIFLIHFHHFVIVWKVFALFTIIIFLSFFIILSCFYCYSHISSFPPHVSSFRHCFRHAFTTVRIFLINFQHRVSVINIVLSQFIMLLIPLHFDIVSVFLLYHISSSYS